MRKSIDRLNDLLDNMDEEKQLLAIDNKFTYLFTKADLFLVMGPELYLKKDFLDWSEKKIYDEEINEIKPDVHNYCKEKA